jgi:hypothetical protein
MQFGNSVCPQRHLYRTEPNIQHTPTQSILTLQPRFASRSAANPEPYTILEQQCSPVISNIPSLINHSAAGADIK